MAAIAVLFHASRTVLIQVGLLLRKKVCSGCFGGFQDSMAFGNLFEYRQGKRVRQTEGDEVEAGVLFPVRQAAAIADMDLAIARLGGAVKFRGLLGRVSWASVRYAAIVNLSGVERGSGDPRYSRLGSRRYDW